MDILDRFYKHVILHDGEQCYTWSGYTDKNGYGRFRNERGVSTVAHKWLYEHTFGPLPRGRVVRHTCDNPPCVRLSHMISGTQKENLQDMDDRGRRSTTKSTTLEPEMVYLMRKMYWYELHTEGEIAQLLHMDRTRVGRVVRGDTYQDLHPLCDAPATHYCTGPKGFLLPFCAEHAPIYGEMCGQEVNSLLTELSGTCFYIK